MTAGLQRSLSTLVLTIWGTTFLYMFFSGRVINALHPSFRLPLGFAGFVLLLLAAGVLFLREAVSTEERPPWALLFTAAILTVPLLIVVAASPDKFDATFVLNRGYVQNASEIANYTPYVEPALPTEDGSVGAAVPSDPAETFLPKTPEGHIKLQTIDLVYAAEEPSMRQDIEGKNVELIGQFMPARAHNAAGNRFDLVRMFMNCCAADARPVAALVQGARPEGVQEMGWVRVVGRATFPFEGGRQIPVVEAESVTSCDPPQESFIY